ncbi:MAG: hypothetical protein ACSW8J_00310, partial [bacterium]
MAAMNRMIKKGFIRYTKKHYPNEAREIIQRADELFPKLYAKAPDIGGRENAMSYNLDLMILSASFYEASNHRIDGSAIDAIARDIYNRFKFLRVLVNLNRKRQMRLFRSVLYKRYTPY